MIRSEKRALITGIVLGLLIAAAFYAIHQFRSRALETITTTQTTSADSDTPSPALPPEEPRPDTLQLSDEEQKSIGVETVEIQRRAIRREITSSGKVAEPETGIGVISARIAGRIDKLLLNVTGETVTRGQAVALIYSPDIVTAAEEYKLALENRQRLSASKESQAVSEADALVQASQRKLELWGLTPQQIDEISAPSEAALQLTVYSSIAGVVTKRNVTEGQYVKEGDILYSVTDLSTVWIQADIFEADIPMIRSGQTATITAPALANKTVQGTVSFLQPAVDPQTRTMTARIQVSNPQMRLRPGMFVQVSFQSVVGAGVLAVPKSAVLDTGKEKVVYVAKGDGVFEKRSIDAETSGDEFYTATRGVRAGERVVTHGNFLIDSQTRLTGTIAGMFGGSKGFNSDARASEPGRSDYSIKLRLDPEVAQGGSEETFHVLVTGEGGKPVTDARVQVQLLMPAMPSMGMGEMRSVVDVVWKGSEYVGKGVIQTAGPWNVTVQARRNEQLLAIYRTRLDAK
jgi:Cu(I)/Ag(I) efflux system membrane fusion protein